MSTKMTLAILYYSTVISGLFKPKWSKTKDLLVKQEASR